MLLAAVGTDRLSKRMVIMLWNLRDHEIAHASAFDVPESALGKVEQTAVLEFAQDGKLLGFVAHDTPLYVWSTKDWHLQPRLTTGEPLFCFGADSQTIATVHRGPVNEVALWNLQSGIERARIPVAPSRVTCLALSRDGLTLFVGGMSRVGYGSSDGRSGLRDGGGEIERITIDK